jgi:hypothetical protein
MDQITSLSFGCVLVQNAIKRTMLMTGLKKKLQSARITNVAKLMQLFQPSFKDTKKLDQAIVNHAKRNSTHLAVRSYVDYVCSYITSVPANTAAISVKVMHILSVSCAKN